MCATKGINNVPSSPLQASHQLSSLLGTHYPGPISDIYLTTIDEMAHPITLPSLTTRDAITDAIYRVVIGLDINDSALFDSAFVPGKDTSFDLNGTVSSGPDAIRENIFVPIGPLDTTHFISNVRVELKDGAETAYVTASALAQHYRVGEGLVPDAKRLLSGSLYFVDVVKDGSDGLWRTKTFKMKIVWMEGDISILSGK
jgi:hypothetical protein